MIDERTLQAAAGALEKNWLDRATNAELDMLIASGERPELFEKRLEDDGEIRVVLGYDATGDGNNSLIVLTGPPKVKDPEVAQAALDLIMRRLRLRSLLGLPAEDCGARKPNRECSCLTEALDELGENADRETIVAAARKRHKRRPPRRWRRTAQVPKEPVAMPEAQAVAPPAPAPNPVTETATREDLKPRWRQRQPAHPLSWRAFKDQENDRIDWLDAEF